MQAEWGLEDRETERPLTPEELFQARVAAIEVSVAVPVRLATIPFCLSVPARTSLFVYLNDVLVIGRVSCCPCD